MPSGKRFGGIANLWGDDEGDHNVFMVSNVIDPNGSKIVINIKSLNATSVVMGRVDWVDVAVGEQIYV